MIFKKRVLAFIIENKLISQRDFILMGVSGGADSMALLSVLEELRHELGISLHVLHFNHRLRAQSDEEESFVEHWCKSFNVPLSIGRRQGGQIKHLSEDDARQMRFQFFCKSANKLNATHVALAHTRNDLAETVLLRLMRGSGLYGLRAILPKRNIEGVSFIRPLLGVDRFEVEAYLKSQKIPFCTDVTNYSSIYLRNKVRHQLLPLMAREFNPNIVHALSDLAQGVRDDYAFIDEQAQKQFKKIVKVSKNKAILQLPKTKPLEPAILRLIIRQMVAHFTNNPASLDFQHINAIEALIQAESQASIQLPQHLKASTFKNTLIIHQDFSR